ncbi:MAG: ribonuclease H-like domain-containing protein [Pseudomonadota bacterium]
MAIYLHQHDLPEGVLSGDLERPIAVDTETMGLDPARDRLCLVQLSCGDGDAHLVKITRDQDNPHHLIQLLEDPKRLKLMHYARFDIGVLAYRFGVWTKPVYCTKLASKLVRTYSPRHGLRDLALELLGVELLKQMQSSDWGQETFTKAQLEYAASDVLYLHQIFEKLDHMIRREDRKTLLQQCLDFLPSRVALDLAGWRGRDIFAHE